MLVMAHTHVALSATLFSRSNLKRFRWNRNPTSHQVFTKGGLNHRGQHRWHFLSLAKRRKRSFELVVQDDSSPLHNHESSNQVGKLVRAAIAAGTMRFSPLAGMYAAVKSTSIL